jgi:hypothetical protein
MGWPPSAAIPKRRNTDQSGWDIRNYSLGFFPPPSPGVASPSFADATAMPLRPLACDFRRLRFSRNASFRRSSRGVFF